MNFSFWHRKKRESELEDELQSHLQMAAQDRTDRGETPERANGAARRELGNVGLIKEVTREMWGWASVERLMQDLRYGLRMLAKSPGFAAVAILTLALGIGANTAVFSLVNSVLLRPLPFPDSRNLVEVFERIPAIGKGMITMPPLDIQEIQRGNRVFESSAAFEDIELDVSQGEIPERVPAARVSAAMFPLLGVSPLLGRTFVETEDNLGEPVCIVSHAFWQRHYAGGSNAIGSIVRLDRKPYTVIGVMPSTFQFPPRAGIEPGPAQVWVPMSYTPEELAGRDWYNFGMIARMKPGVTPAQAQTNVSAISADMYSWMSKEREDLKVSAAVIPLRDLVVKNSRGLLLLLLGAIFFVMLIACANIAGLLLSRSSNRRREIAIRTALGAGRNRVLRLVLAEYATLAVMGGTLGVLLAWWIMGALVSILPDGIPRLHEFGIDWNVLGFAAALSVLTGLSFGLVPAFVSTRVDLNEALKEGGRNNTISVFWKQARSFVVIGQIALALVLLVGGALLVRSFLRVQEVMPGVQAQNVLTMSLFLPKTPYGDPGQIASFDRELLSQIERIPAVRSVALATSIPLGHGWRRILEIEGNPESGNSKMQPVANTAVLGDYFSALGIPLREGRVFTEQDLPTGLQVVIISEGMARRYWPGKDPLGKRLRFSSTLPWMTIVGVVGDVKDSSLELESSPHTYQPYLQLGEGLTALRTTRIVARTDGDPLNLAGEMRVAVQKLDPQLPLTNVRTMDEIVNRSMALRRFNTFLFATFALAALLLAAAGIYGVVSYGMKQRVPEIGLRMALGAQPRDVMWLVLGQGARLALGGVAIGVMGGLGLTQLMSNLLFGISATDPLTYGATALLLIVVAFAACYVPARRAIRVDPIAAMRYE